MFVVVKFKLLYKILNNYVYKFIIEQKFNKILHFSLIQWNFVM